MLQNVSHTSLCLTEGRAGGGRGGGGVRGGGGGGGGAGGAGGGGRGGGDDSIIVRIKQESLLSFLLLSSYLEILCNAIFFKKASSVNIGKDKTIKICE